MATISTASGLQGKVVIVTGSSRGIGEEIAYEFGKHGAKVMITYVSESSTTLAQALVTRINSLNNGAQAVAVRADLRDPEAPAQLIQATLRAFDTDAIDVLVNNAGTELVKPITETTIADYENVFDINVRAVILLTKAVIPVLRAPGRIINISSMAARRGAAYYGLYAASKAALEGFSRACAAELGAQGHSVNVVSPGPIVGTEMFEMIPDAYVEEQKRRTAMQQRLGTMGDVAPIVVWLASESARWVTAQTISATGGAEMY
ncbi:hypothetical protein FB107DRAFT_210174 [Schizophyllum commune]